MPFAKGTKYDFLTAGDAYDLRKRYSVNHLKTVYGLIEDVERRVHIAASTGGYDLVYTVPVYSSDLPVYNQMEMREELIKHFRRHGFMVMPINQRGVPMTSFYLSWTRPKQPPPQQTSKFPRRR
jgi:hypothetical protein